VIQKYLSIEFMLYLSDLILNHYFLKKLQTSGKIMAKSKIWYFENFNFFEGFTPEQLMKLEAMSTMKTIKKNDFVYIPNELSNKIFLLKEGTIKIGSYSDDGRETLKTVLRSGEIFGELSLTGEDKRGDFAQAAEPSVFCAFEQDNIEQMFELNPKLSFKITKMMGFRLKRIENKLNSMVFKDARNRIIDFLLDQANLYGQKVGFETLVWNKLTHKDIANLTATSRQTVTTVLNDLRQKNLIYFDRKRILIRDLDKLA